MRESSDERILGGGDFVDYLLKEVNQKVKHQFLGQDRLKKVEQFGILHFVVYTSSTFTDASH